MSARFRFDDLPGELRNRIYEYTVKDPIAMDITLDPANGNHRIKVAGAVSNNSPSALIPLSIISKKVHEESSGFFWAQNIFRALEHKHNTPPHDVARAFFLAIGPLGRRLLQNLSLVNVGSLIVALPQNTYYDPESAADTPIYVRQASRNLSVLSIQLGRCQSLQKAHVEFELEEVFSRLANGPGPLMAWQARRQPGFVGIEIAWKPLDDAAADMFLNGGRLAMWRGFSTDLLKEAAIDYLRFYLEPECRVVIAAEEVYED
ncbi:hypothetical protein BU16DRAFT_536298 [Lophium mytilinum]|uniref:F-box domain-containing protein n=1 Tax=Lophium mytilinum TaxID=390894 RepID=A0A6A6R134_9PEZI|nr:hypothetical protein BU16DRAFT_536298 [Lophium mytilinum]